MIDPNVIIMITWYTANKKAELDTYIFLSYLGTEEKVRKEESIDNLKKQQKKNARARVDL